MLNNATTRLDRPLAAAAVCSYYASLSTLPMLNAQHVDSSIDHCCRCSSLCATRLGNDAASAAGVSPQKSTATAYDSVHHITPPWGGFPSSVARHPRGCQSIPNDTSSEESSQRDVSGSPTFLAPTLFQLWRYRPMKIVQLGVMHTAVPGGNRVCIRCSSHRYRL